MAKSAAKSTLIRTLRKIYGQSFAAGYPETEKLKILADRKQLARLMALLARGDKNVCRRLPPGVQGCLS
jgi:hypothetical protein